MMVLCYWSTVLPVFRSLVALSLILAMLLFKPAPIYILDEVDAALDLSHTQNIGQMLRTHFRHSQVRLKHGHIIVDEEPEWWRFRFPPAVCGGVLEGRHVHERQRPLQDQVCRRHVHGHADCPQPEWFQCSTESSRKGSPKGQEK